jgi:enoyl-CoA hydratase/carnithine racemase
MMTATVDGTQRVACAIENHIALVELNRPDKRNALDGAMFAAIADVGERLKSESSVRAVVLTGRGTSFCAGLDMASFERMADEQGDAPEPVDPMEIQPGGLTHLAQQIAWVWRELPVPVIAAVHGHAIGGGLQLALGADIRIAHPATKLSIKEVDFGITPDMTGTYTIARLARPDVAMLLASTAATVTALQALELGLVTRLSAEPLADAMALAGEIAARSPDAIRGVKRLIREAYPGDPAQQLATEREVVLGLAGAPNQLEAVRAAIERRAPAFTDDPAAPPHASQ